MLRLTFLYIAADIYMEIYLRYFIYSDMIYIYIYIEKYPTTMLFTIILHK